MIIMEQLKPEIKSKKGEGGSENKKENEFKIEQFYDKYISNKEFVNRISLDNLRELKEKGISTEKLLDYMCQTKNVLLHGSVVDIQEDALSSPAGRGKIFASNKAVIAIMRSIYSNVGANLEYPYFINEKSHFYLQINTYEDGKFRTSEKGFVYVVKESGFVNEPEGSWQFVNNSEKVKYVAVIETEKSDFKYPIEVKKNLKELEERWESENE